MNEPLQLKTLNLSEEGQKYFIVKLINKSALKVIMNSGHTQNSRNKPLLSDNPKRKTDKLKLHFIGSGEMGSMYVLSYQVCYVSMFIYM